MKGMEYADRVRGAVRAGALADALGSTVEAKTLHQIQQEFGASGLRGFGHLRAVRGTAFTGEDRKLPFSANTQLLLYTMDALTELIGWANEGVGADDAATLWLAYLRWYKHQAGALPESLEMIIPERFIDSSPWMRADRSPSRAVMTALGSGEMGHPKKPANPNAQDPSALLRSLPFGLVPHVPVKTMLQIAQKGAALTHGHPDVFATSMVLTAGVRAICEFSVPPAQAFTYDYLLPVLEMLPEDHDVRAKVVHARSLGIVHRDAGQVLAGEALTHELGSGEEAADCLALALYLAITAGDRPNEESFAKAVLRAVNISGNSTAVATVTAQLLGAAGGNSVIPASWLSELEQPAVINELLIQWLRTMA